MTDRDKELVARHCLLHLEEIPRIWHRKEWTKLAAIVEYAQRGIPVAMSKTDPYMYRQLCAGLAEYHTRGFDLFDLDSINALAVRADGSVNVLKATIDVGETWGPSSDLHENLPEW